MNNNILVTGGCGYIGSHICYELKNNGFIPIVYDNLSRSSIIDYDNLEIGDISDSEKIINIIKKYNPIAVIHLAAFAYVEESMMFPSIYYYNNVAKSIIFLNILKKYNINNIIFSSTCAVYGNPVKIPINEDESIKPINIYGKTKYIIEEVINDLKFNNIRFRYFNVAGHHITNKKLKENHNPETHLIPILINSIDTSSSINIYGNDYNTYDGTCIRDYIHVMDIATAHILALKKILNISNCNYVLNIGTNKGYSINEIISEIEHQYSIKLNIKYVNRRIGDPDKLIADYNLIKNVLNWNPLYSNIKTIISSYKN